MAFLLFYLTSKEVNKRELADETRMFLLYRWLYYCDWYQLNFFVPREVFMQSLDACIFGRRQKSRYNRCCRIRTSKKYKSLLMLHTREYLYDSVHAVRRLQTVIDFLASTGVRNLDYIDAFLILERSSQHGCAPDFAPLCAIKMIMLQILLRFKCSRR